MWWVGIVMCLVIGGALGWLAGRRSRVAPATAPIEEPEPTETSADEQERRLLRIVEALPLGVLVFDESRHQLFANGAAHRYAEDRLHEALVRSAISEVVDAAADDPEGVALRMLELYGSPRTHLSIRGVPVGASVVGESAVVVTIEDVTELRSADALRRDFVANVSHELKTPIGAISVLAETLLDVDDPEVAQRLAGRLQNEALRLADTVDELLTLARIESGEHGPLSPVRLDDVMVAVVGRVEHQSQARSVTVGLHIDPQDLTVTGDRVQLVSAFGNLVDNAVKYSPEASTVEVAAVVSEGTVTVTVTDHGVGIPEADLERVFERFYRVDRGRSRDTGGTGLGLSIVRHVVLNHGGEIAVSSKEGQGTTFAVTLPLASSDTASTDTASSPPNQARSPADVG